VGALAVLPQAALADVLAPESPASSSASDMRTVYIVMLIVTTLVFIGVVAALLRGVARARRSRNAEPEHRTVGTGGVQRRVGIGIGVVALALFVVGVVFTEKSTDAGASSSGAEPIEIKADAQQWLWRYEYPAKVESPDGFDPKEAYSYYDLVIPVDTPITMNIGSTDVIHTWSVPALARSVQATPGDDTSVTFVADEEGTYYGSSRQFSGPAFPTLRTAVHVVSPEEYDAFVKQRTEDINAARSAVQEKIDNGTAPGVQLEK
jgi:heme/copper-type cytochrome/quinol oxidase subunit 2